MLRAFAESLPDFSTAIVLSLGGVASLHVTLSVVPAANAVLARRTEAVASTVFVPFFLRERVLSLTTIRVLRARL